MKVRVALSTFAFIGSIVAVIVGAGWLSFAVEAYSPLEDNMAGTYVPAFTKVVIAGAPRYPTYMAAVAALTSLAAVYFWRCTRPTETKTFAVSLLATINMLVAGQYPMFFLLGYFILPRAVANAA